MTGIEFTNQLAENIILYGTAFMAIAYGLKRVYVLARNVEKLLETSAANQELIKKAANASTLAHQEFCNHATQQTQYNELRDQQLQRVSTDVNTLASDLKAHITIEEQGDKLRDTQLNKMTSHMTEIIAEIRPNGGSSMKDLIQSTNKGVETIKTRVDALENWRKKNNKRILKKPRKKTTLRSKRK